MNAGIAGYGTRLLAGMTAEMTQSITLAPINGFTLKDRIYQVLRDAILKMDVYARDAQLRLDERLMARQLGISRTPLREALIRLENEGIVEIRSRKGVFVIRRSIEEVVELITVWAAIECMAARLACEHAGDRDFASLRKIGSSYTSDSARMQIDEYSQANIDFHRTILGISGCKMLTSIGNDLFAKLEPVRRHAMTDASRTMRSIVDHSMIVDALEARDADLAETLVRDHTLRLGEYIVNTWQHLDAKPELNGD